MPSYKTPGVYVEEIPVFPPSVAQVETAIPAFIGYAESAKDDEGNDVSSFPYIKRIKSLLEYEQYFGAAQSQPMAVEVSGTPLAPSSVSIAEVSKYRMYYAMQMFFSNGGGPCYVVCVSKYTSPETVDKTLLINEGLAAVKKKDEPTLLLFPDAAGNMDAPGPTSPNYHDVLKAALAQCNNLGDRFLICDLNNGDTLASSEIDDNFRTGIGNNFLKYGAAYHPWLKTGLDYRISEPDITFSDPGASAALDGQSWADIKAVVDAHNLLEEAQQAQTTVGAFETTATTEDGNANGAGTDEEAIAAAIAAANAAINGATTALNMINTAGQDTTDAQSALDDAYTALAAAQAAPDQAGATAASAGAVTAAGDAKSAIDAIIAPLTTAYTDAQDVVDTTAGGAVDINDIKAEYTEGFVAELKALLDEQQVVMPPASALAGVYALVDRTRGVWKAPANVSLNNVLAPLIKISNSDQESLNVSETGKSINAIRSFTGKGILVWGGRTLAGNDNEWRYVSVRRFFNMVEESVKKATEPFVFEPNDANTWVRVRAMIENFLVVQWRAGALAGATPEEAFFVRVGLGQTMTSLDILEGRMNVEIGMAAVRPAEFIILKFSHKMQTS